MALQNPQAAPGRAAPDADRPVLAATCQQSSIGTPGHGPGAIGMTVQGVQAVAGFSIPQADRMIIAAACQQLPIRAEADRADRGRVALQYLQAGTRLHIPD